MADERVRILKMLEEQKITIDEAERLLRALGADTPSLRNAFNRASASGGAEERSAARYLNLHIEKNGADQVRVRVPLALIRAGVRLGSLIPPHTLEQIDSSLHEKGIQFDLRELDPKKIDELVDALTELTVDVDNGNEKVRIFCA